MMDFTPLKELQLGQRGCKIKCRLARLWDSTNPKMKDELMSVDFLLIDNEGSTIQGSIRKQDAPQLKNLLTESKIYVFANFIVAAAKKTYRVCQHETMIQIGPWTIIKEEPDIESTIPMNSFHLPQIKDIEARLYNDTILTDVIGHITSVERLSTTYAIGRNVSKKNMVLHSFGYTRLPVTLWGSIAEAFNEENVLSIGDTESIIAILTSMTVRSFKGEPTLSSTSATKVYVNQENEETISFRNSLLYPHGVISLTQATSTTDNANEQLENKSKTIMELLHLDRLTDMGKKYTTVATIEGIDAATGWWYNACPKCKAGVTTTEGTLSCRKCGPIHNIPIPWYKLNMTVADGTAEAKFLVFGKHIERLLKISADQLCDLPGSTRTVLPPIIEQLLCGKKYTFIVSINDRDNNPHVLTFNVSYMAEEPKLLDYNMQPQPAQINTGNTTIPADKNKKPDATEDDILISSLHGKRKRDIPTLLMKKEGGVEENSTNNSQGELMATKDKESESKDKHLRKKPAISKGKTKI
ncbi:replication protein A 70 kDa DNA-binding subunit-like [Tripterygium wilfordii]|uniref:replication protein A 70 kDa DNA-binding subunit-like n=1 Tax=Tripterygium wilfordii TaxID=458696 RepID=UPI0018F86317|nr:replication protein A 70 kDa DNA-binding subunit-like [Tripterygium wilfordii]